MSNIEILFSENSKKKKKIVISFAVISYLGLIINFICVLLDNFYMDFDSVTSANIAYIIIFLICSIYFTILISLKSFNYEYSIDNKNIFIKIKKTFKIYNLNEIIGFKVIKKTHYYNSIIFNLNHNNFFIISTSKYQELKKILFMLNIKEIDDKK